MDTQLGLRDASQKEVSTHLDLYFSVDTLLPIDEGPITQSQTHSYTQKHKKRPVQHVYS